MGVEGPQGLGVASAAVFDVLSFVGDDTLPAILGKDGAVVGEGRVGSQNEIVFGGFGGGGKSGTAVMHEGAELGGKSGGFATPVFYQRGRGDD